jgi:hypothetical protein
VGCDNIPYSKTVIDVCGECGGTGGSCAFPSLVVGAVVGGVGGLIVLSLIIGLAIFFVRKTRRSKSYSHKTNPAAQMEDPYGYALKEQKKPVAFNPLSNGNEIPLNKMNGNISKAELKMGSLIGTGSFGEVYQGEWRMVVVAIKKLKQESVGTKEFCDELMVMKQLKPHPNIVQFLGFCKTEDEFMLVMVGFCDVMVTCRNIVKMEM